MDAGCVAVPGAFNGAVAYAVRAAGFDACYVSGGAVSVNGEKAGLDDRLTADRLLHGRIALLRRGKKAWHVTRWA